jgi:hypothetical protein
LFISVATLSFKDFHKCINEEFRVKPVPEPLVLALFGRFRQFKVKEGSEGIELSAEMDIIDFLLGINLLSRITIDQKIKCKFSHS